MFMTGIKADEPSAQLHLGKPEKASCSTPVLTHQPVEKRRELEIFLASAPTVVCEAQVHFYFHLLCV